MNAVLVTLIIWIALSYLVMIVMFIVLAIDFAMADTGNKYRNAEKVVRGKRLSTAGWVTPIAPFGILLWLRMKVLEARAYDGRGS